jgi:transposase
MSKLLGGKHKNDRHDSWRAAEMLRTNALPLAYICPPGVRPVRDLLRRRTRFVQQRAGLLNHMNTVVCSSGQPALGNHEKNRSSRAELIPARMDDPLQKLSLLTDISLAEHFDALIGQLENAVADVIIERFNELQWLLRSIPGLGRICAMTLLYEIVDIDRFDSVGAFCSYSRVCPTIPESNGKPVGSSDWKNGNAYLKWAFTEVATHCLRYSQPMQAYKQRLQARHGRHTAARKMAHRLAKTVYFMLKRQERFDLQRFLGDHAAGCLSSTSTPKHKEYARRPARAVA